MREGIFLGSEIKQPQRELAYFHVIPAPYEASVSYGDGTCDAPAAIINASSQLEIYDGFSEPYRLGIFTHKTVDCRGGSGDVLQRIRAQVSEVVAQGNLPFTLGGEHTVTYGAVMGVLDVLSDEVGIVQFDAHADLRDSYEGNFWSHACVMKRLVDEELYLYQLGVRAFSLDEQSVRDSFSSRIDYIDAINLCRPPLHEFKLPNHFPKKIYITVDVDCLDALLMPATGTPVPGGLNYWQLLDLFSCACRGREVVGIDLVEFAPIRGFHAYDYTMAELVYKMMGIVQRTKEYNTQSA